MSRRQNGPVRANRELSLNKILATMNTFNKQLWCNDGDRGHTFAVGRYTDAARTNFDVGFYITMAPATSLIASPHTPPPINLYKPANVASTDEQDKYIRSIIVDCLRQLVDDSVEILDDGLLALDHDYSGKSWLSYPPESWCRIIFSKAIDIPGYSGVVVYTYEGSRELGIRPGPNHQFSDLFYFENTGNISEYNIKMFITKDYLYTGPLQCVWCGGFGSPENLQTFSTAWDSQENCVLFANSFRGIDGNDIGIYGCHFLRWSRSGVWGEDYQPSGERWPSDVRWEKKDLLQYTGTYDRQNIVAFEPAAIECINHSWELTSHMMELIKEAYDTPPTFTI